MAEKKAAEKKENKLTIEESFSKIEEIIEKLENPEISLEDSFQEYQAGMKLLKDCDKQIEKVEKKVLVLEETGETHEF